ncbi:SU10 major capsid protein, partial [Muribaculum caecicola]|uniref:SU10 major capsid protein n=4 Tax=Muribaculum TaxID=1918540 RepID=UPI0014550E7F
DENDNIFPLLAKGTKLIRMGRAAAELDVQTSQSQVLPKKTRNYCQIFKAQVEQSVLHRLAAKEVGITLSDQEEMALMDMRLGIEKSFLFGAMARIDKGAQRGDVFLTQGIWPQAGQQFEYKRELFTQNTLVEMARMAFTGNAGSSRKVLVAGSGLIETISKLSHTKVLQGMQTTTRWGLDFREIITNFGRLYVILSEVFDLCGHPDDGMVIDPEYIQKYVHIPFKATPLDLRSSGQRNCDAMVLTEASCLVLRYPNAHMRIVRKPA